MAKCCDICGKKPQVGNSVSHAHNKTKRRWMPNLRTVRIKAGEVSRKIVACTKCIRQNRVLEVA